MNLNKSLEKALELPRNKNFSNLAKQAMRDQINNKDLSVSVLSEICTGVGYGFCAFVKLGVDYAN